MEAALDLAKRILDAQEHDLAGRILHVFRNAQHPADRLDFDAEVQFGAVDMRAGLEPHKARIQVEISDLIAELLDARLDFGFLRLLEVTGLMKGMNGSTIVLIMNAEVRRHGRAP